MLVGVFTKTLLDRWRGMTVAAVLLALVLLGGMAVYRDVDLSLYGDLPEAIRALMNIGTEPDASGLAYGAVYGSYGAMTMAAMALSMGAASIAGEERDGTIGLLLANPRSRTGVLLSKAASMVTLVGAGSLLLWGAGLVAPRLLDVSAAGLHIGALVLHMFAISVFFGALALGISGWTGSRGVASGVSAGVLVLSFFAVGLFPLIRGWENVTRVFPWYYYEGSRPISNGVDWPHLGLLAGAATVFAALGVVGLHRRDLRERGVAVTLLDRLRSNRYTRRAIERLAGSARVSRVSAKAASDHQTLAIVVGYAVLLFGVWIGPFYLLIDDALADFVAKIPEVLLAMIGYADMTTPEGWYQTENFSMTIPIALLVVTIVMGSKALAGEEAQRTMGLLLANPISRTTVVIDKTVAMLGVTAVLVVLTFLGTVAGSMLAGLGMSAANIAAVSALAGLLGLVFGALALALGAATGSVRAASFGSAGAAFVCYVANAFLPLNEGLAGLARWSPFYYYLTRDPLNNGMPWGHAGVLAALTAALVASAVMLFRRRDLRG